MKPAYSLRRRLLLWLLLPLVVLMLAHAWWTYARAVQVANEAHDRSLYLATRTLAEELFWRQGQLRLDVLRGAGYLFENHTGSRLFYRVDDVRGNWLAGNPALPLVAGEGANEVQFFSLVRFADGLYRGEEVRLIRLTHIVDGGAEVSQPLFITVAETREVRDQLIAQILRETVLGQGVLMLLVLALVFYGVQRGMRPLEVYRQKLSARADDDFSAIDVPSTPRELRPLFEALNGYLSRLGRLIDIRKRFLDNAAHQLRTPLTVLKTQLTLAERSSDAAQRETLIHAASHTTHSAVQLTEQLLALTRAEHGSEMQAFETVDLVALARQVTEEWLTRAHERGDDLGLESQVASSVVQAAPAMLHEALANLIDNALAHGRSSSRSALQITVRVGESWIEVEDDGSGISSEHQTHVFERFYRAPGSAALGSGLGLAIVREIAQQHGAKLVLTSPVVDERGTCIRLSWAEP
ncbi:MAG: sensor histidine kinase [Brachymonas sp.]|nr:sensor histidine kinase [Brachymonas sp.]